MLLGDIIFRGNGDAGGVRLRFTPHPILKTNGMLKIGVRKLGSVHQTERLVPLSRVCTGGRRGYVSDEGVVGVARNDCGH